MSAMSVLNVSSGSGGWQVGTGTHHAENVLRSGIQFGIPPQYAVATDRGPLQAGVLYSLELYRWVGSAQSGTLYLWGQLTFRP